MMDKAHLMNQYQNYLEERFEKEEEAYNVKCEKQGRTPAKGMKKLHAVLQRYMLDAFERGIDGIEPPKVIEQIREGEFEGFPSVSDDVVFMLDKTADIIEEAYNNGKQFIR